ncbi:hypothetical protein C6496_09445 [Candidatus Poribacteria bacterium]|nr:MAG: hypothetical protein C6496_09445 [Candidatus Poribacteria bacterium]
MKTRFFLLIFTLSLFVSLHATGQVVFYADFEPGSKDAIPDAGVNDIKKYKAENAGTIWAADDFEGGKLGGKGSMKQTAEGCGISGNTPLPGVTNFTDGIVQMVFSFGDDDSVGLQFRRKGDDNGYLAVFGYNETASVLFMDLADGCCPSGQCLDQCGCENGGKELESVPHGLGGGLDQTNAVPYFGRVEVDGKNVKIWYMELAEVDDLFGPSEDLGAPILEYKNADYTTAGSVGIWHESWGMGRVDSVLVTNANGFDVDAKGKLTTSWGEVKSSY